MNADMQRWSGIGTVKGLQRFAGCVFEKGAPRPWGKAKQQLGGSRPWDHGVQAGCIQALAPLIDRMTSKTLTFASVNSMTSTSFKGFGRGCAAACSRGRLFSCRYSFQSLLGSLPCRCIGSQPPSRCFGRRLAVISVGVLAGALFDSRSFRSSHRRYHDIDCKPASPKPVLVSGFLSSRLVGHAWCPAPCSLRDLPLGMVDSPSANPKRDRVMCGCGSGPSDFLIHSP